MDMWADLRYSARSLTRTPGLAMEYSNLGYALLGRIVANVSGQAYKDFVRGLVIVLAVAVYARRSVVRRPPRFGAARPAVLDVVTGPSRAGQKGESA